jgi:hypothetical protein
MYVKVRELPETLRRALAALGYARPDVDLKAAETYTMQAPLSGQGKCAFVCAVDLATGQTERKDGSWGGANMFNPKNQVDLDSTPRPLVPNFAVIYGYVGDGTHILDIRFNPATLNPLLPAQAEMSHLDRAVLEMYAGLTSAGRKNQIERWLMEAGSAADPTFGNRKARQDAEAACRKFIDEATNRLVAAKLVTRNKAGAITVTTEGKNTRGSKAGYGTSPGGYRWFPGKPETPAEEEKS